jgi:uncharacterized caspase-like protein
MRRVLISGFFVAITVLVLNAPAAAERRVALVIGNSAYVNAPALRNPRNDAQAMAAVLGELGFEVITGLDLSRPQIEATVHQFAHALKGAETSVLYYAGHGFQLNGINYLVPVDAKLREESDVDFQALPLDTVLKLMERQTPTRLVFLDACRDNPFAKQLARSMGTRAVAMARGLARVNAGSGTFIALATGPDSVASDGQGEHSPFTKALLDNIKTPGLDIALLMRKVKREVQAATGKQQVPWEESSLTADFYFNPAPAAAHRAGSAAPAPDIAQGLAAIQQELEAIKKRGALQTTPSSDEAYRAWLAVEHTDSVAVLQAYIERFPASTYVAFARARLKELQSTAALPNSAGANAATGEVTGTVSAAAAKSSPPTGGFMFPDSDRRHLTRQELAGLSQLQLHIARNEIYARRGRYFRNPELANYFSRFAWYRPNSWDVTLNDIEDANVHLIMSLER